MGLGTDLSSETFVGPDFDDRGTETDKFTGRGCILKFAGPNGGEQVEFYAANNGITGIVFLVRHGGQVASNLDTLGEISGGTLGQQPICGYAVRTEAEDVGGEGGEEAGDTRVYFFATNFNQVFLIDLLIPTGSADRMGTFLDKGDSLEARVTPSGILSSITDADLLYNDNEGGRKASTVWMGDNRSLILISSSPNIAQYDANTNSISLLDDAQSTEKGTLLFATRATQADKENLGCM